MLKRLVQRVKDVSVAGVCRIILCIIHNSMPLDVSFDHQPDACISRVAWLREGLPVLPVDVVCVSCACRVARHGWTAVLKFLRPKVRSWRADTKMLRKCDKNAMHDPRHPRRCPSPSAHHHLQRPASPFARLRHVVCLVLNAAAACPIFDLRSMRPHYLQHSRLLHSHSRCRRAR